MLPPITKQATFAVHINKWSQLVNILEKKPELILELLPSDVRRAKSTAKKHRPFNLGLHQVAMKQRKRQVSGIYRSHYPRRSTGNHFGRQSPP